MPELLKRSYYKLQIIILFSLVAIAIVIVASRISYLFAKELYLEQISEQVNLVTRLLGNRIDEGYLQILDFGTPVKSVREDFIKMISENNIEESVQEAFIFNEYYVVLVHSDRTIPTMRVEQRLFINRNELSLLEVDHSFASLPFKGDDGSWYMWGFYNFNDRYYLAVRESAARLQRVEEFSLIFWFIGLGGVIITILLSWFVANKITGPINKLVSFSLDIGKGRLNLDVPNGIKGETKILADAMDTMRKGLAKNQEEKERILAQIAHEIRNPLGSIEILAGLVKEDLIKSNQDYENTEKILGEVRELKEIITSYLNFSRPATPKKEWCDLSEVYDDIIRVFQKECKKKNCTIKFENHYNKIWFDKSHLKMILTNLIANSLESIERDGSIKLISTFNDDQHCISVIDNGKGIDDIIKSKIFDPFYTTKSDGTGLGLATSRKLCIENNAELLLESANGNETKFSIIKSVINDG
ncbi:MAG: HAMP domain-containing sensor histidine kinase [Ignavibacteria bacterium]|jgi:signal transduction histidine kinase